MKNFILTYNYANVALAKKAINCVIKFRTTSTKNFTVKDIIELIRPGLY